MSSENESKENETVATTAPPAPSAFFGDGYQITGEMPTAMTGFAPVKLVFRPITADEQCQFEAWRDANRDKPTIDFFAPLLAKSKLIDWNLTNHKGARIEPSEKNIRLLASSFYNRLLDVVGGYVKLPNGETEGEARLKN